MVGESIDIDNINIIVGHNSYNGSGIVDSNDNGLWDPGETIYLYGLDLTKQTQRDRRHEHAGPVARNGAVELQPVAVEPRTTSPASQAIRLHHINRASG